jgi:hypothetical protein
MRQIFEPICRFELVYTLTTGFLHRVLACRLQGKTHEAFIKSRGWTVPFLWVVVARLALVNSSVGDYGSVPVALRVQIHVEILRSNGRVTPLVRVCLVAVLLPVFCEPSTLFLERLRDTEPAVRVTALWLLELKVTPRLGPRLLARSRVNERFKFEFFMLTAVRCCLLIFNDEVLEVTQSCILKRYELWRKKVEFFDPYVASLESWWLFGSLIFNLMRICWKLFLDVQARTAGFLRSFFDLLLEGSRLAEVELLKPFLHIQFPTDSVKC